MNPAGSQGCIDPGDVVGSLGTAFEVAPIPFGSKFILLPLLGKAPAWSGLELTNTPKPGQGKPGPWALPLPDFRLYCESKPIPRCLLLLIASFDHFHEKPLSFSVQTSQPKPTVDPFCISAVQTEGLVPGLC